MKITFNILISLFVMQFMMSCQTETETQAQNTLAVAVTLAKASSNSNNNGVNTSGQIAAKNSANLSTRMMGNVTNVYVRVGDQVKKGDLLLSINNADLKAKYAQFKKQKFCSLTISS